MSLARPCFRLEKVESIADIDRDALKDHRESNFLKCFTGSADNFPVFRLCVTPGPQCFKKFLFTSLL